VEWRDDALLAWDGFRQSWLDLEGRVLSTAVAPRPLQPGQETGINAPEFALAGGGFLYRDSRPEMIDQVLVHVSEEGEVRDTLLVIDITSAEGQLEVSTGGVRFQRTQPFLARDVVVVQPRFRSLVVAEWILDDAPRARVVRRTVEGDTIFQVFLAHRPVLLRAEVVQERAGTIAQTLMNRAPQLSQGAAQRLVRGALDVPEQVRPATEGLGVDDGGVWLHFLAEALGLEPPSVDETSGSLWVDLDPAGGIRAVVASSQSYGEGIGGGDDDQDRP